MTWCMGYFNRCNHQLIYHTIRTHFLFNRIDSSVIRFDMKIEFDMCQMEFIDGRMKVCYSDTKFGKSRFYKILKVIDRIGWSNSNNSSNNNNNVENDPRYYKLTKDDLGCYLKVCCLFKYNLNILL